MSEKIKIFHRTQWVMVAARLVTVQQRLSRFLRPSLTGTQHGSEITVSYRNWLRNNL